MTPAEDTKLPFEDYAQTPVSRNASQDAEVLPFTTHSDIAYELYAESLQMDPIRRGMVARSVLRKLDFIILPMMCLVYLMSFLDKQTLNYSNAYGLQTDLNLHGTDYSWVASVTNIGYLVFAYPSSLLLQKFPIGKFVSCAMLLWGSLLMLTVLVHNWSGLMAVRFFLGGAEACIGPAWILLTSMFWTREEQPFRMSFWLGCNGIAQLIGAGLSWGLGHAASTVLESWQLVFLVVGAISFGIGAVEFFLMPSSPNDCIFFSHEEKVVAVWRVAHNRIGVKSSKMQWYQVKESVTDIKIYLIAFLALAIGILNGSVTNFMSSLLKGFGFSSEKTLLYQLPNGAIQFVVTIIVGYLNTLIPNILCLSIALGFVPGICGMIGIATIPLTHQTALAACAWLQAVFGVSIILSWSLIGSNVAGHTKRATANGVNFVCYAAGNIVGPFLFFSREAPRYLTAIKILAGMYAAAIVFTAALAGVMWRENRRRDARSVEEEAVVDERAGDERGFEDRTDGENEAFRYRL